MQSRQGGNLEAGAEAEFHGGILLADLFLLACSAHFL